MKALAANMKTKLALLCSLQFYVFACFGGTNLVLTLDGNGDYVTVPSAADLQNPDELTVEAWVFPTQTTGNRFGSFINKGDGLHGESQRTYELRWRTNDTIGFAVFFALPNAVNQPDYAEVEAPLPRNSWIHVAATYSTNASGLRLYTNGVLAAAITTYGSSFVGQRLRQTSLPLIFGATPGFSYSYASGGMDEIRVWARARSAEEIARDFSCRLTGVENGLAGYWNFDANSANDLTGHGHHGTLIGNASTVPISGPDVIHAHCPPSLEIRVSQVELCWDSTPTNVYQLQYRSILTTNQWVDFGSPTVGDGSRQCTNDFALPNEPQRFYRLVVTP